ncbi:hypothetical protein SLA2020_154510 [Shorea laevis]
MDLSHAQSALSLGFGNSHVSSSSKIPAAVDSISLQSVSSKSNPVPRASLQFLKQARVVNGEGEDFDGEEERFSLLGHAMCLKRQRDPQSPSNTCKRVAGCRSFLGKPAAGSRGPGVMEALGSHLTNKYSEGMPGARYYTGNQCIDQVETLCCERALAAFSLDSQKWGVNVQPYSCTSGNFAVYTGLLQPGDRIMGLDSPSGGHMSHGYYQPGGKKISAASIFFQSFPYKVNPQTGYIDYDKLEEKALDYPPKILICGGSSYPREWDYARFRQIADRCGAVLMCDMAHISGLVAAKECASPFDYCDIVTSTTHKSLRGPRGVTGGTDNHLLLWDLTTLGLTGKYYEKVCEMCHITLNKTAIYVDNGAISPGGVRIGTPAMTSRGCLESDFETIADFLFRAAQITSAVQREHGKLQKEFLKGLQNNNAIVDLQNRVEAFAEQFGMPGFDI